MHTREVAISVFDSIYQERRGTHQLNKFQVYALRTLLELPLSIDQKAAVAGQPIAISAAMREMRALLSTRIPPTAA